MPRTKELTSSSFIRYVVPLYIRIPIYIFEYGLEKSDVLYGIFIGILLVPITKMYTYFIFHDIHVIHMDWKPVNLSHAMSFIQLIGFNVFGRIGYYKLPLYGWYLQPNLQYKVSHWAEELCRTSLQARYTYGGKLKDRKINNSVIL